MIKAFKIRNHLGDILEIDLTRPELSGFIIRKVDGLGPVKANVNTVETATNDGSMFNSARATERNIVFNIAFYENGGETVESLRHKTYKYFPLKKQVTIYVETHDRYLETTGYVESNEPDIFSNESGCQISILCPESYFYSSGPEGIVTTTFFGVDPEFEFEFSNESLTDPLLNMSEIQNRYENNVFYEGDADIGIKIIMELVGTVGDITIQNSLTKEVMILYADRIEAIIGSALKSGDTIIINTVQNHKYITFMRDGVETNILNAMDKDSDWFSLTKGDNIFAFYSENGLDHILFTIENRILYEGV